jgi:hypothetical protein
MRALRDTRPGAGGEKQLNAAFLEYALRDPRFGASLGARAAQLLDG